MITHTSVRGLGMRLFGAGLAALMTIGFVATQTAAAPTAQVAIATPETKHVKQGERVHVRGRLSPQRKGRTVLVQHRKDGHWVTADRDRTGAEGRFETGWRVEKQAGRYRTRVVLRGNSSTPRRVDKTRLFVYRPGNASYYGPGLYGNRTACGQTLTPSTVGVANRWLPCGTRVTFRYHGRTATVPVIDRGPYSGSRIWDLTYAAKRKLGFGSTGVVWSTR